MSRMKLLVLAVAWSVGGSASTYQPTQGMVEAAWGFEWIGADNSENWTSSLSVVNLGGGGVVSRSLIGKPGVPWGPPDEWWLLEGDFVYSTLPDFTGWYDYFQLRAQTSNGGLRISEKVRSDSFQVDLVGWPRFLLYRNSTFWVLHPVVHHDQGWELGFHDGKVEVEFRIYWQPAHSSPVLVYSYYWKETDVGGGGESGPEEFEVPGWEEPIYECEAEAGCWEIDFMPKASGVLWWEHTVKMDLVGTPEVPEAGTAWLTGAGVLLVWLWRGCAIRVCVGGRHGQRGGRIRGGCG